MQEYVRQLLARATADPETVAKEVRTLIYHLTNVVNELDRRVAGARETSRRIGTSGAGDVVTITVRGPDDAPRVTLTE